jgi:hypothetical protein
VNEDSEDVRAKIQDERQRIIERKKEKKAAAKLEKDIKAHLMSIASD